MTPDTKGAESFALDVLEDALEEAEHLSSVLANMDESEHVEIDIQRHMNRTDIVDLRRAIEVLARAPTNEAEGRVEYEVVWNDGVAHGLDSLEAARSYLASFDESFREDHGGEVRTRRITEWVTLPDTEEGP